MIQVLTLETVQWIPSFGRLVRNANPFVCLADHKNRESGERNRGGQKLIVLLVQLIVARLPRA